MLSHSYLKDLTIRYLAFITFLLLGVSFFLYAFVLLPKKNILDDLNQQIEISKNRYFYGKKLLSDSSNFSEYKKLVTDISEKSKNIYSSSVMVSEMSSLFDKSSIRVVSENYSKIKYTDQFYSVTASFSVEGNYSDIKMMIYKLPQLSYIVNVSRLDMVIDKKKFLSANINISIVGFNDSRGGSVNVRPQDE